MQWAVIVMCYVSLLALIYFAVSKKKKRAALIFGASFVLTIVLLFIWGIMRNF